MKKPHWTQTEEGKARMADVQRKAWKTKRAKMRGMAKEIVKGAKRGSYVKEKKKTKETALVINGWRIILGKNEVRIDND